MTFLFLIWLEWERQDLVGAHVKACCVVQPVELAMAVLFAKPSQTLQEYAVETSLNQYGSGKKEK